MGSRTSMSLLPQVFALWVLTLSCWGVLAHPDLGSRWTFDVRPPDNGTSNAIFDNVANLLQQWGNTRFRNGHTVVPVTIPVGTILYHGTHHKVVPTREFLAMDAEHAYPFCRDPRGEKGEGCFLLTVAVSHPLSLLYFDGSSAAKMYGAADTQDLIAWGKVVDTVERIWDEWTRLDLLCAWATRLNLDGFLRMEMDFEIMLCDLSTRVEVVSFIELDYPNHPKGSSPTEPPPTTTPGPIKPVSILSPAFRILEAGHWHNHFPGETRAQLDLTRLISLYDLNLFPSLVDQRYGKGRWEHRGRGISDKDTQQFLQRLESVALSRPGSSSIDWTSIYRVVIHRYADRLELLQYMLNHFPANGTTLARVHGYAENMLTTYIPRKIVPSKKTPIPISWASPVFEQCTMLHVDFISKVAGLTQSEELLLKTVYDVLHEICRVLTRLWAEGVELKLDQQTEPPIFGKVLDTWRSAVNELMRWLDWSIWAKCKPTCDYEEVCYMPTWPFFHPNMSTLPPDMDETQIILATRSWNGREIPDFNDDPPPEWKHPQPRCMRRLAPLEII